METGTGARPLQADRAAAAVAGAGRLPHRRLPDRDGHEWMVFASGRGQPGNAGPAARSRAGPARRPGALPAGAAAQRGEDGTGVRAEVDARTRQEDKPADRGHLHFTQPDLSRTSRIYFLLAADCASSSTRLASRNSCSTCLPAACAALFSWGEARRRLNAETTASCRSRAAFSRASASCSLACGSALAGTSFLGVDLVTMRGR